MTKNKLNDKEDYLVDLNEAIDFIEKEFKEDPYIVASYKDLLALREAWVSDEIESINRDAIQIFHVHTTRKIVNVSPNTKKAAEINNLLKQEWSSSFNLQDPKRPINKYKDEAAKEKSLNQYAAKLQKINQDELVQLASELLVQHEIDQDWISATMSEASFLRTKFLDSLEKRETKGQKTSNSIQELHQVDKTFLINLYFSLAREFDEAGKNPPELLQFKRRLLATKKQPTFTKNIRLTSEEKLLPEGDREHVIHEKKQEKLNNNGWSESWIRQVFSECSQQPGTTKKKSSSLK